MSPGVALDMCHERIDPGLHHLEDEAAQDVFALEQIPVDGTNSCDHAADLSDPLRHAPATRKQACLTTRRNHQGKTQQEP